MRTPHTDTFRTPEGIFSRLNKEVVQCLRREDVRYRFLNAGIEPAGSSPQELAAALKSEMPKLGKVIQEADIRED